MSLPQSGQKAVGNDATRTIGFGLRAFKRYPELLPMVGFIGFVCVGAVGFVGYSLYQKPDVKLNKYQDTPPWERVNPEQSQKFYGIKQEYKKIEELEKLKKEIGPYKL